MDVYECECEYRTVPTNQWFSRIPSVLLQRCFGLLFMLNVVIEAAGPLSPLRPSFRLYL